MQPPASHDGLKRIIRALRQATVICATLGCCLLAGAFVLIPVIGFVSADIGAVGSWCLLLAAFLACFFAAVAAVGRVRAGEWYFGGQDPITHFVIGHRGGVMIVAAGILIWIGLVLSWLNMP
jgi:hypothetical protein